MDPLLIKQGSNPPYSFLSHPHLGQVCPMLPPLAPPPSCLSWGCWKEGLWTPIGDGSYPPIFIPFSFRELQTLERI